MDEQMKALKKRVRDEIFAFEKAMAMTNFNKEQAKELHAKLAVGLGRLSAKLMRATILVTLDPKKDLQEATDIIIADIEKKVRRAF